MRVKKTENENAIEIAVRIYKQRLGAASIAIR
jgi:hypothetical protein